MGLMSTDRSLVRGEAIIVSIDKDMRTIPGKHSTPQGRPWGAADLRGGGRLHLLYAGPHRDPTDGYYGVKGIGPKKAEKILREADATPQGFWRAIVPSV